MTAQTKRLRRAVRKLEPQSYVLKIVRSAPSYHLSAGDFLHRENAYLESASLELTALFVAPKTLSGKRLHLTILGQRELAQILEGVQQFKYKPTGIGTLTARKDRAHYLGSLPLDTLWQVAGLCHVGALRVVYLHGLELYRGKTTIHSITFEREIDPEDWG